MYIIHSNTPPQVRETNQPKVHLAHKQQSRHMHKHKGREKQMQEKDSNLRACET